MDNPEFLKLLDKPENVSLLNVMIAEHPDIPQYFLKNALLFYLTDSLKFVGNKKKRGRKPKPPAIQTEIKGAVTVS